MRICVFCLLAACIASAQAPRGFTPGKGYGPVYGPADEVGALNAISSPEHVLRAVRSIQKGRIYDLGVPVDASSYKWPGHSPTQIMSFRSPEGVKRQADTPGFAGNAKGIAWHSCALFISDNLGTQIDGLAHLTTGADNHWYNGFREADWGGDFGVRKADADSIPPIVARAVLIDVAGWKGVEALPANFPIGPAELQAAMAAQKVTVEPGDAVFIRTGTLRHWGRSGADHAKLAQHDSAGLTLAGARWLVEQRGAVFIGADTSGLEVGQDAALPNAVIPVHEYLLIEQGVHIGEFHFLEDLARDKVFRFTYVAATNRLRGTVAGTALRPFAIH